MTYLSRASLGQAPSLLFTIRLWQEEIRPGVWEWRGKLQQVRTGETHYFRTQSQLHHLLHEALPPLAIKSHDPDPPLLSSPGNSGAANAGDVPK